MRLRRFACLLLVLCAALPAAAQDATDARAVVRQAITNLAELPGYHFTYELQSETTFADEEEIITIAIITSAEGDTLANGDNFTAITFATGASLNIAEAMPRLHVERTVFNGNSALNFELEDSVYAPMLPFDDGWQSYDDLSATVEDDSLQSFIDNINNLPLPATLFSDAILIRRVTELASETIDGVPMRVFDVEIDAEATLISNTPVDQRLSLMELLDSLKLIGASELSATSLLWIGADDGQIYRGTFHEVSIIPYLSSGNEDWASYDSTVVNSVNLTLSQHGEPVEIEPVILAN